MNEQQPTDWDLWNQEMADTDMNPDHCGTPGCVATWPRCGHDYVSPDELRRERANGPDPTP